MFIESFTLPSDREEELLKVKATENGGKYAYIDNPYPCGIFDRKELYEIYFRNVTIFYGSNGSGKSTLLNIISEKLELNRIAPFNKAEMFDMYVSECSYKMDYDDEGFIHRIPDGSRMITSDDIFDYMLTMRTNNDDVSEKRSEVRDEWNTERAKSLSGEPLRFTGLDEYEDFRFKVNARSRSLSRRKFIRQFAGEETKLRSNGETALDYFDLRLKNSTLYCLDEPENSMSPAMQLLLVKKLEEMSRYCGCQFIIATHSPFLLALEGARIYDLDSSPVEIKNWWELENTKIYFDFFNKHRDLFEKKR